MPRRVISEETFTVAYDGPALADHSIDVRDLAMSVLAVSDAFHRAQAILDPEAEQVSVRVKAHQEGSFEIVMLLVEWGEGAMDVLLGRPVQSLISLGTLTGGVLGAVKIVQGLRGRRIKRAREIEPGLSEVEVEGGATLEVPSAQLQLVRDIEFRKAISEVAKPLGRDGVDVLKITDRRVHIEAREDDLAAFAPPTLPAEEDLNVSRRETLLQPVGVEFDGRKWRFTEGGAALSAGIEDPQFRDQIERGQSAFKASDLLKVRLRSRQFRDRAGFLRLEHTIEAVLDHIDGGRQIPLDGWYEDPEEQPDEDEPGYEYEHGDEIN